MSKSPLRTEFRATLALAVPLIIGNFAQTAINTTDVLILGWYDVNALAAAALAVNLYFAFGVFGMGLVTAASPMIAAERGRRLHSVRDVRRTVRQAWWLSLAISLPIWAILWHSEKLLLLLGQQPDLAREAARFLDIAMWGLFPFFMQITLRYYVSALEKPLWGMIITSAGVVFNAVVCWILVFGKFGFPQMGLEGAAWAGFLANSFLMVGMIMVVTWLHPFRRYRLFGRFWVADWPRFGQMLRIGLPIAITLTLEVAVFSAAAFLMGRIGGASLAAHAIALQISAIAFMVPMGLAQAATVRVGYWHGAKDAAGVARSGRVAFTLGVGAALLLSCIMALSAPLLVGLFMDVRNPATAEVFGLAVSFVLVGAVFQLVDGAQAVGAGVLRGLQDTRWPMLFAAFGYWVLGISTGVTLAFYLGFDGVGVWVGLATGLAAVSVMMVWRWSWRVRLGLVDYATPGY